MQRNATGSADKAGSGKMRGKRENGNGRQAGREKERGRTAFPEACTAAAAAAAASQLSWNGSGFL